MLSLSAAALSAHEAAYGERLALVAKGKKRSSAGAELVGLDGWVWGELGDAVRSRSPQRVTKAELEKLMRWKLSRGKFRPALPRLVASNSEKAVREASEAALAASGERKPVQELAALRGVGPATASALLAAVRPGQFPFMADEALAAVLPKPWRYSMKEYTEFAAALRERAGELGDGWTPQRLSQALWSAAVAEKLGVDANKGEDTKKVTKKEKMKRSRAVVVEEEKAEVEEEDAPTDREQRMRKRRRNK